MRKKLGWIASLAAVAVVTTALAAGTAGAKTTPVSVDVSGTQTIVDEAAGTYAMHGSLVGTWQITKFKPRYASASQFVATGDELFTGCLDSNKNGACDKKEPTGSLKFTFMYWASFDPASGALVHGECVHPITGRRRGLQEGRRCDLHGRHPEGRRGHHDLHGNDRVPGRQGRHCGQAPEPELRERERGWPQRRLRILIPAPVAARPPR